MCVSGAVLAPSTHFLFNLPLALRSVGSILQVKKWRRKGPTACKWCSWTAGGLFCFAPSRSGWSGPSIRAASS